MPICSEPLLRPEERAAEKADFWWLAIAGRLGRDVSLAQADAQMRVLSAGVFRETLPKRYPVDAANQHCGGKIVSVLEGGYNLRALGRSVVRHLVAINR